MEEGDERRKEGRKEQGNNCTGSKTNPCINEGKEDTWHGARKGKK